MNRFIHRCLTVVGGILLVTSCEKVWLGPEAAADPVANFEYLWEEVDQKYSYFEHKGVDWNRVYEDYRPRITEQMTGRELFDVLAEMLYELEDGHVNLSSSFDRSRNWDWYLDYPSNFNREVVYRNYLGGDYLITGPLHNQVIDSVLYIYYGSFAGEIREEHLDFLVERSQGLKGMIIDIRNNGGGSLRNGEMLASALVDEKVVYARKRIKNGPGKEDFSPWEAMTIEPREGKRYEGPVVVLCNRSSYSASSLFAQMMKSLSHATLLGDHTGGGGGFPAYGELPNGWIYRVSVTQVLDLQGDHIEDGVAVDLRVDLDPGDERRGIDTIIEEALRLF